MGRLNRGPAAQPVLALNCGSSSLKFGLYLCGDAGEELLGEGEAEEIGRQHASFWFRTGEDRHQEQTAFPDHEAALSRAFAILGERKLPVPAAIGHRFVHGGRQIRGHQVLTPAVMEQLRAAAAFAPLHGPAALAVLEAAQRKVPKTPQIVCLDTAFHRTMPDLAKVYALPAGIRSLGVGRYGFHGLSLESIMAQLQPVPERVVVAHLGNGSSITAIRNSVSVDTTMGLTPTGGVMMGSRCGDLDPGIVVYLMRNGFTTADELEIAFNRESGLLGVSEITSDVRDLLKVRKEDARADLALRMFCYQIRKAIAAMAGALGGIDLLVFTGGIGEHAGELRDEICQGLDFIGPYTVRVLPSREDLQIARITATLASSQLGERSLQS